MALDCHEHVISLFVSQIALRLEHNDSPYISTLVTLPNLWGKGKGKSKASSASTDQNEEGELPDVLVTLTPVAAVALGHSKDQQDTHVSVLSNIRI